jgi:branched-chain amino acid aminotransferase
MDTQVSTHQAEDDTRNEDILIWVNGQLKPRAAATVNVHDAGFMPGDGVWEGLRLYNGRWTFLDAHIDRFCEAALAIDLDFGRTMTACDATP